MGSPLMGTAHNYFYTSTGPVNRVIAIVDRQENHKVWDNNEIEFISLFKLEDIIK